MSAREIKKTQLNKSKSKSRVGRTISNRGLTLIELLVTMSIATIILVAVGDLGTMTLRTSMLAKAQSTTVDLKETLSSALESGSDSCKGNLAPVKAGPPPFGELSGANQNKGVGQIDILRQYAGTTKGAVLVKKGEAFKGDLDVVTMRLIDPLEDQSASTPVPINDPKTASPKTRDFYVFFKMRGVGPLGTKGPDCKETSTLTKLKSDCYSVKCTVMKYRLNPQTVTSHADFNKVDECGEVNCIGLSKGFGGGGSVACYTVKDDGRTLVGCGGTDQVSQVQTTAFGFGAGKKNAHFSNTFIGYKAGTKHTTGHQNVFIGSGAGFESTTANENIFIGAGAGGKTQTAGNNVYIGSYSGFQSLGASNTFVGAFTGNASTAGNDNVFLGFNAGKSHKKPQGNTMVGQKAGADGGGADNFFYNSVFLGVQAGLKTKAGNNTFLGAYAGRSNTFGGGNVFIGDTAGWLNETGNNNVFIGQQAGYFPDDGSTPKVPKGNTTGSYNVFIGNKAGTKNTTASNNTFIGYEAGKANTIGGKNIFIGAGAAKTDKDGGVDKTKDRQLNIGNLIFGHLPKDAPTGANKNFFHTNYLKTPTAADTDKGVFIYGDLFVSGEAKINCDGTPSATSCNTILLVDADNPVDPKNLVAGLNQLYFNHVSSRFFKKNIVPFTDYNKALQDILTTPLFNFQYKKNHPDKIRMGIIAEDLPKHLQLKSADKPVMPDMPTITGTLWAGIKELYNLLQIFKTEVLASIEKAAETLKQILKSIDLIKVNLTQAKKSIIQNRSGLEQSQAVIKQTKDWLSKIDTKINAMHLRIKALEKENGRIKEQNKRLKAQIQSISRP